MKDRMFLVQHNGCLFAFPVDKAREAIDFALKKLGSFRVESKNLASKVLESPETVFNQEIKQPYVTFYNDDLNNVKSVNLWLVHDGLQAT